MLNQTFNPQELKKLISNEDISKFKLGYSNDDVMNSITSISYEVSQKEFKFIEIQKRNFKGRDVFTTNNKNEFIALKKLNSILKRLYTVSYSSRSEILTQLIEIIKDGSDYKIIRADIKDFFDNVPRSRLINKFKSDSILGSLMINKLRQFDVCLKGLGCTSLPRGISLSSTLSEIYLRDFDKAIKNHNDVYYYARYVDDIVIVCLEGLSDIEQILKSNLDNLDLELNDKYKVIQSSFKKENFDYLGVNFSFNPKGISLSLSKNKVNKLKTRIIKSILDYKNNRDDDLLVNRIKFITSNYALYTKTESNNLKAGIYYNNQHINDYSQLNELNEFLRKSFTSQKGSLSKASQKIPKNIASICMKQCFFKGYIEKKMINFDSRHMSNVVRCW
tara:strand:- start:2522 stop:3691 length:1170 start_codon:yes stop_codon:yes gene_type:complete